MSAGGGGGGGVARVGGAGGGGAQVFGRAPADTRPGLGCVDRCRFALAFLMLDGDVAVRYRLRRLPTPTWTSALVISRRVVLKQDRGIFGQALAKHGQLVCPSLSYPARPCATGTTVPLHRTV